ncbi:hypothetical protein O3M35_003205 [Rhynocoris fuscipes]|uniref:L-seryl-tRNA(Sec) kinase n=1 Tax=Rhynocoris fuscipes TaxID=488301 RepID=A0AAW1CJB0_9HEMI
MESTSVCLICLIGLPSSGKSTLSKEIETKYKFKFNVEIIIFDKEICWNEEKSWKNKRKDVRLLVIKRIEINLRSFNQKTLIILDDNMFYRSMRYEYYQIARKYRIGFCEIYLNTPIDICLKLNKNRNESVNENTILKMNSKLEKPDSVSYKWEKNHLIFKQNLYDNDWKNFENLIENCLQIPADSIPNVEMKIVSSNLIHLADIALRKIVNELIKKEIETNGISETYCHELANKRRIILERIRSGEIVLPEISSENPIQDYSEILRSEIGSLLL